MNTANVNTNDQNVADEDSDACRFKVHIDVAMIYRLFIYLFQWQSIQYSVMAILK